MHKKETAHQHFGPCVLALNAAHVVAPYFFAVDIHSLVDSCWLFVNTKVKTENKTVSFVK